MSRPTIPKGVPDIENLVPKPTLPPPASPEGTIFSVGDKVKIVTPDQPDRAGTITKLGGEFLRMAFVTLDNPTGAERYVPFRFLAKING